MKFNLRPSQGHALAVKAGVYDRISIQHISG